jgi:hypothetical protein
MRNATAVQLERREKPVRVWLSVGRQIDMTGQAVDRLSLDIPLEDALFLERYAEYRNAVAVERKLRLRKKASRKSVAEEFLITQVRVMREEFAEIFKELGEFPSADDPEAMARYARKVVAWDKRSQK